MTELGDESIDRRSSTWDFVGTVNPDDRGGIVDPYLTSLREDGRRRGDPRALELRLIAFIFGRLIFQLSG
jgi:hypothetical protein